MLVGQANLVPTLAEMWAWTAELPLTAVMLVGVVDTTGGLGALLPTMTRILPRLTVLAALECIALQINAAVFHAGEAFFYSLA